MVKVVMRPEKTGARAGEGGKEKKNPAYHGWTRVVPSQPIRERATYRRRKHVERKGRACLHPSTRPSSVQIVDTDNRAGKPSDCSARWQAEGLELKKIQMNFESAVQNPLYSVQ